MNQIVSSSLGERMKLYLAKILNFTASLIVRKSTHTESHPTEIRGLTKTRENVHMEI